MKFTVITPTLNAAEWIRGCVQSVEKQIHVDLEHIVIDGGSTDGTMDILRQEMGEGLRLKVSSESDDGLYDAMNKGLARSEGDYILFLGADDRLSDENVLCKVAAALREKRWDLIYGNVSLEGKGWDKFAAGSLYDGEFDLDKLLHKNICHQAIFYSRNIIEKAGWFNPEYRYFADWDYNLRCYSLGEFKYINLTISEYNTEGRSTGGEDNVFHASYFEEVRRYLRISVFSRHFRDLGPYLIFAGKLRLKRLRDPRGLLYFAAAFWHSHAVLWAQVGQAIRKLTFFARRLLT